MNNSILFGVDLLASEIHLLKQRKVAVLANCASVDRNLRYTWQVIADGAPGALRVLMSPQHGLFGEQQANMITSPHELLSGQGIPVYSLYSETRRPTEEMVRDIDLFVIDLQDVGTRVYTFIWTVLACLEEASQRGIEVWLLDRPNPIGGRVEGPVINDGYYSFVGELPIPMRHGLTIGELARWCAAARGLKMNLRVFPCQGYRRDSHPFLNRHWLPPSPNMPTVDTAAVYPGQVLLEGLNVSEGRGTTTPFQIWGAPWIDPVSLKAEIEAKVQLAGTELRPVRFVPTFDKYAGQRCQGLFIHVTDASRFDSYRTTLSMLLACKSLWPDQFQLLPPPYEYETVKPPLDILSGSDRLRLQLERGQPLDTATLESLCQVDLQAWRETTKDILLYQPEP